MNSKSRMSESWNGAGLHGLAVTLLAAVFMLGCERPLPDADKNPESKVKLPEQSPTLHDQRLLHPRIRRAGPRTLVTQGQTARFLS